MSKPEKQSWQPADPAHQKLMAYIVVAVFIAVMAVMGMRSVSGPQLFQGDKLETVTCQVCQGSGHEGNRNCRLCLTKGKVEVIMPGPLHPVDIRGSVRDAAAFATAELAQAVSDREAKELRLQRPQGAVGGARLTFEKDGKKISIEGAASGWFHGNLPPGTYQVTVTAEGYQELHQSLEVPVRQKPVWPNRMGMDLDTERLRPVFLMQKK